MFTILSFGIIIAVRVSLVQCYRLRFVIFGILFDSPFFFLFFFAYIFSILSYFLLPVFDSFYRCIDASLAKCSNTNSELNFAHE